MKVVQIVSLRRRASKASNCLIGNKSNNSSVHDKNAKCLKVLTTAYDSKLGECSDQGHYVALGHNNAVGGVIAAFVVRKQQETETQAEKVSRTRGLTDCIHYK